MKNNHGPKWDLEHHTHTEKQSKVGGSGLWGNFFYLRYQMGACCLFGLAWGTARRQLAATGNHRAASSQMPTHMPIGENGNLF